MFKQIEVGTNNLINIWSNEIIINNMYKKYAEQMCLHTLSKNVNYFYTYHKIYKCNVL